jgi:hypothetical protein
MRRPEPEDILKWSVQTGDPAEFKGHRVFKDLWEKGKVIPYHTVVKVIQKSVDDVYYFVNESGLLVGANDEGKKALNPKEVLSKEKSPDGWHIYKFLRERE